MVLLFDGPVFVQYGFVYLTAADDEMPDLHDSCVGQVNGLLGAGVPGALTLVTATHTGNVSLRIEWSESEPAVDPRWEDVVEVSFQVPAAALLVSTFDDAHDIAAPDLGSHRARLSAMGMDGATEPNAPKEGELASDRYLLQLWPARPAPDAIVRQTSRYAAHRHSVAHGTSTPIEADRERPSDNELVQVNETELFDALDDASLDNRLAARTSLISRVLTSARLDDEPAAIDAAASLARSLPPTPAPDALYELLKRLESAYTVSAARISDDAAWRRSRAVSMLLAFCGRYAEPPTDRNGWQHLHRKRYRGWHQASLALGDDWPAARIEALTQLRRP